MLRLALLGPFQATLDGAPVAGLSVGKAQALLGYLAVEADRPHTRESLATLLWPESRGESSLASLRNALALLRRAIGDTQAARPSLLVTRSTLQHNPAGDQLSLSPICGRESRDSWPQWSPTARTLEQEPG